MTEVRFPQMSKEDPGAVGILATWFARDGETVIEGQLLAEVQMDKIDAEVPAPVAGTVSCLVEEGAEVAQGALIATIT